MRKLIILLLLTVPLSAQILDTEVWVGRLDMSGGRFAVSELVNVSEHPGYDNQPSFLPDGKSLLFTTEASSLDDSGLGVHAVRYDLGAQTHTPLPAAKGFSPTPSADGRQLMVLRQGRVFLHDSNGKELAALTATDTAGYFTRFDDRTWALFMNDPERRIVIYDARTKRMQTMARGALTAPYRVPGARAVTFVSETPFPAVEGSKGARVLIRLDLRTKKVEQLATIPFATAGHHVWTSRGTLLMASGPTIYEWSPARPAEWTPIYRAESSDLQGITRIAISPAADRIALVSTTRPEVAVRNARAASNAALAKRDASAVAGFFQRDGIVVTASGVRWSGREEITQQLTERYKASPETIYVRTPLKIDVSAAGDVVSEKGTWVGNWTEGTEPRRAGGDYMAVWRRTMTDSGTPAWSVATEVFAALE